MALAAIEGTRRNRRSHVVCSMAAMSRFQGFDAAAPGVQILLHDCVFITRRRGMLSAPRLEGFSTFDKFVVSSAKEGSLGSWVHC